MKVESNKAEFQPIVLAITLETKKEAEAFFSIFNHIGISDYLKNLNIEAGPIRHVIGDRHNNPAMLKALRYELK